MTSSRPLFHQAHYNIIAGQINKQLKIKWARDPEIGDAVDATLFALVISFADRLEQDNPRFNKRAFYEACVKDTQ